MSEFLPKLEAVRTKLKKLAEDKKIILSSDLDFEGNELMRIGIEKVGSSHPKYVLRLNKKDEISTQSMKLLYYYHNKLSSYELEEQS